MPPPAGRRPTVFVPGPTGTDVTLRASVDAEPVASTDLHQLDPYRVDPGL